jgi:hypothetical protein
MSRCWTRSSSSANKIRLRNTQVAEYQGQACAVQQFRQKRGAGAINDVVMDSKQDGWRGNQAKENQIKQAIFESTM